MFFFQPTNPFEIILNNLPDSNTKPLTLQYLDWVNSILGKYDHRCKTYSDIIEVLEFMEEHNLIKLIKDSETGTYVLEKIYKK